MIVPYLFYADAPAAIDFLCKAFGFEERLRYPMPDGRIGHAEIALGEDLVMLASIWEGFGDSPLNLPNVHAQIYCFIDEDIDAHFLRARVEGAVLVTEPKDEHGTRSYRALDTDGHRWVFGRKLAT